MRCSVLSKEIISIEKNKREQKVDNIFIKRIFNQSGYNHNWVIGARVPTVYGARSVCARKSPERLVPLDRTNFPRNTGISNFVKCSRPERVPSALWTVGARYALANLPGGSCPPMETTTYILQQHDGLTSFFRVVCPVRLNESGPPLALFFL